MTKITKTFNKILIIRTSAIGDVIMASPLISALKSKYPQAQIHWLAEPFVHDLIRFHPDIDKVHSFPKTQLKTLWREKKYISLFKQMRQLKLQLQSEQFDLALDVQGLFKSGIWAWLAKATTRVGFRSKEGAGLFMTDVIDKPNNEPTISSEYQRMAEYLQCDTSTFLMDISISNQAITTINKLILSKYSNGFAVISPFTTREQKHWTDENWRKFTAEFYQRYKLAIIIVGGPNDARHAESLCHQMPFLSHVCGQLSLNESVALIAHAKLVVGVDTGMTHAGIAKQTPTLALFGSTRPYLNTRTCSAEVVYLNKQCAPCKRKPTCGGKFECMTDITPAMVMDRVSMLLEKVDSETGVKIESITH